MQSGEVFVLERPKKANPTYSVTWAYPNSYAVGMAGLGYQLIWWLLEQNESISVKRAFTDIKEEGWRDSELLGFTLSWELDYANVFAIIKELGLPLAAKERTDGPLIFGGGPVLAANPEPFAAFFDVILIGDAEVLIPSFLAKWESLRNLSDRRQILAALGEVDGIYVPSLYECIYAEPGGPLLEVKAISGSAPAKIKRQTFTPGDDYVAHSVILAPESTWGQMFLTEIVRSCPQECRFCLASFLNRPFRATNVEALLGKIDLGLRHTKKIGLLGPSVTEHPQFDRIAESLLQKPETEISVASIRADTISPLILEMLVKLGQKSVTIALESGSERLRAVMKKNLSEAQILSTMELIAGSGLKGVKLYGIAGLPGETEEDLQETVRLLTLLKKQHKQLRITFGISSFVPKAQTPFQWSGRMTDCARRLEKLRKPLAKIGIDVRPESHNWSDIQALLSRGDRRLTELLLTVADSPGNLGAWRQALRTLPERSRQTVIPGLDYYAFRNIPYDEVLPWQHLVDDAKTGMLHRHSTTAEAIAAGQAAQ